MIRDQNASLAWGPLLEGGPQLAGEGYHVVPRDFLWSRSTIVQLSGLGVPNWQARDDIWSHSTITQFSVWFGGPGLAVQVRAVVWYLSTITHKIALLFC